MLQCHGSDKELRLCNVVSSAERILQWNTSTLLLKVKRPSARRGPLGDGTCLRETCVGQMAACTAVNAAEFSASASNTARVRISIMAIGPIFASFHRSSKYRSSRLSSWCYWITDWLTVWLNGWLTGCLTDWLTVCLSDWLTDWLTDCVKYHLVDWLNDWLCDWLEGWIT